MKIKISELTGPALDWAVASAAGYLYGQGDHWMVQLPNVGPRMNFVRGPKSVFSPSTRWAQGGPIIEQECIEVSCLCRTGWTPDTWNALDPRRRYWRVTGPTPLVAAMRCFVLSKSQSTDGVVDVPKEFAMTDEEMSFNEALRLALSTMYQSLDEIAMTPEEDHKYLRIPPKAIREAVRIIDIYMREQS